MKIVKLDNYGRDNISDVLIAESITKYYADKIVKLLNDSEHPHSDDCYKVKEDDYKLYEWRP